MLYAVMGGIPIREEIEYLEKREQSNFSAQVPPISNYTNSNITSDYISSWSVFVWANTLSKDSRIHLPLIAFPTSHHIINEGLAAKQPIPTSPIYLHLERVSSLLSSPARRS